MIMESIVILGFGGHAKSVADSVIRTGQYRIAGYTDLHKCDTRYDYWGPDDMLVNIYQAGIHKAVLGIGYMGNSIIRDVLVRKAQEIGFEFPTIIDPSAIIASDVEIDEGTFVGKNVVVNSDTWIGKYCIINTGSIIEHENIIGDYSHISVGTVLCGNVKIGHHSMIGAGTIVIQGKSIGDNVLIGANSTVLANVEDNMKCYGAINGSIKNNCMWGV